MEIERRVHNTHGWRSEYIDLAGHSLSEKQIKLLEKGADDFESKWMMMDMFAEWKRIKGYTNESNN